MTTQKTYLALLISVLALTGCSGNQTSGNGSNISKGQTMKQIMERRNTTSTKQVESFRKPLVRTVPERNNINYTRTERNELKGLFPRLPNPDLCPYTTPHLTAEKATVPGYTSCFSMYEGNHYALPGELNAVWQQQ